MLLWLLNLDLAGGLEIVPSVEIPIVGQPDILVGCPAAIAVEGQFAVTVSYVADLIVNYEAEVIVLSEEDIGV